MKKLFCFVILIVVLSACGSADGTPTHQVTETRLGDVETQQPVETSTPVIPTPTSLPMAAVVNEEGITLLDYQAELGRFAEAAGREITDEDEQFVLNSLISEVLLAQAAAENGFLVDNAVIQERLDKLVADIGGEAKFNTWLEKYRYDQDSFRRALSRSIGAAWMRDHVASTVPLAMEQVHVQQVRVPDAQEANVVLGRLDAGADFKAVAFEYDPAARGELGWFPRGYLAQPLIEEAAFSLEAGQYSRVIETDIGYHVLFLSERDPERALEPDALLRLQSTALQDWLKNRWEESEIQTLVN